MTADNSDDKTIPYYEDPNYVQVKDTTRQRYEDVDEKDFHIRTIRDENLITPWPERDDNISFSRDMFNLGDADDLPDSDREMACRARKIPHDQCFGLD